MELQWMFYLLKETEEFFRFVKYIYIFLFFFLFNVWNQGSCVRNMGWLLSLYLPQSQAFSFYATAFILAVPAQQIFSIFAPSTGLNALPWHQQHSWPQRRCSQGAEFVTRYWDRDMFAVRHGTLISPCCLAWPSSNKAISLLTTVNAPCTSLGVFAIMQSYPGGKWLVHSSTRISMWCAQC